MSEQKNISALLEAPFGPDEIEWRPSHHIGFEGNYRILLLAYITARAAMNRLDDVFGKDNWEDHYQVHAYEYRDKDGESKEEYGMECKLKITFPNEKVVTKTGFAPFTNVEPIKGGESDALKRAAVKFGIGRYLYNMKDNIVPASEKFDANKNNFSFYDKKNKKKVWLSYENPEIPNEFLPKDAIKEKEQQKIKDKIEKLLKESEDAEKSKFVSPTIKENLRNKVIALSNELENYNKGLIRITDKAINIVASVLEVELASAKEYAKTIRSRATEIRANQDPEEAESLVAISKKLIEKHDTLDSIIDSDKESNKRVDELKKTLKD